MQVCTSLQTDNHTSTPQVGFLQARCPSCRPSNSVTANILLQNQYCTISDIMCTKIVKIRFISSLDLLVADPEKSQRRLFYNEFLLGRTVFTQHE